MKLFIRKHSSHVAHTLSGFDRLRFRGTISLLSDGAGLRAFLNDQGHSYYKAREFFAAVTAAIIDNGAAIAKACGRPLTYLQSSSDSKQDIARQLADEQAVDEGLIAVLTCVEPCWTYAFARRADDKVEWLPRFRKCLHQYFYFLDQELGVCQVRIQTWCPFRVTININGREWLARQMDKEGIEYVKADNCFLSISDPAAAQRLALRQTRWNFNTLLDRLCRQWHPAWDSLLTYGGQPVEYYWTTQQCEWATDIVFRSRASLDAIYEDLIRFALLRFDSPSVMRFLGQKVTLDGQAYGQFKGDVFSDCRCRPEGIRIRHYSSTNSVKMYNKQHRVLRVETTVNDPRKFNTERAKTTDPQGPKAILPVLKGVAGIRSLTQAAQEVNDRYLEAQSAADVPREKLNALLSPLAKRIDWNGRFVRGLRFFDSTDAQLLTAVGSGEFLVNGFRNRDIRDALAGGKATPQGAAKLTNRVTRMLRMLRAHGLIEKIDRTHRYQVTTKGNRLIAALAVAQESSVEELLATAA